MLDTKDGVVKQLSYPPTSKFSHKRGWSLPGSNLIISWCQNDMWKSSFQSPTSQTWCIIFLKETPLFQRRRLMLMIRWVEGSMMKRGEVGLWINQLIHSFHILSQGAFMFGHHHHRRHHHPSSIVIVSIPQELCHGFSANWESSNYHIEKIVSSTHPQTNINESWGGISKIQYEKKNFKKKKRWILEDNWESFQMVWRNNEHKSTMNRNFSSKTVMRKKENLKKKVEGARTDIAHVGACQRRGGEMPEHTTITKKKTKQ